MLEGVALAECDVDVAAEVKGALGECLEEKENLLDAKDCVKVIEKITGKEWKDI